MSLVQAPNAFFSAMADNPDEFNSWLDGLDSHTFLITSSRGEVEDELMEAYLSRLKELMLNAAQSSGGGEHNELAKRAEEALAAIEVRRVW